MIELARNHGALAAKVTGAGGGGCVLALLPASKCDENIANLREQIGDQRIHPIFIP
jgi:mevalonate kinase